MHPRGPARSFGPHWWAWNLLLAAAPAAVLWAGLSRTKSQMEAEVVRLQAEVASEKERQRPVGIKKESGAAVPPPAAASVPPVAAAAIGEGTTEERLRRLEAQLARIERGLRPAAAAPSDDPPVTGATGKPTPGGMAAELAGAAVSGIRRRVLEAYEGRLGRSGGEGREREGSQGKG